MKKRFSAVGRSLLTKMPKHQKTPPRNHARRHLTIRFKTENILITDAYAEDGIDLFDRIDDLVGHFRVEIE